MTTATLTEQYVMDILTQQSDGTEYPVAFDDIWESSGYTAKKNAIRFLTKRLTFLKEGKDYVIRLRSEASLQDGRSSNSIHMTKKAYHFFLSKSNTPQGDINLEYLIEIEEAYRKRLEDSLNEKPQDNTELDALKAEINLLEQQLGSAQKWAIQGEEMYEINTYRIEELVTENNKLKKELEDSWQYGSAFHDQSEIFEARLEEAKAEIKRLTEENALLNSDDEFQQVSPDLRVRRAYWTELMLIYSENVELREKLGMPPKTVDNSKKPKK